MFDNQSKYVCNIVLPASTASEVIEWFEIMDGNGILADSLIELVCERLKSGKPLKSALYFLNNHQEVPEPQVNQNVSRDDFFDSLYDWQGANSAAFKEEKEEKKVKKKMLYV